MIRQLTTDDFPEISRVVNDAATRYRGVIPPDRYHEPYMPEAELRAEMRRIRFYGWFDDDTLLGVMGLEEMADVTLIRHAYVETRSQGRGIGSALLEHVESAAENDRILIGTWRAADWAVRFYEGHGYRLLADGSGLLRRYWDIPDRQIETSVVLEKDTRDEVPA